MIELDQVIYFKDDTSASQGPRETMLNEHLVFISMSIASTSIIGPVINKHLVATPDNEPIEEVD